jgi:predicted nucleotide-binding protein with TIR-like domain
MKTKPRIFVSAPDDRHLDARRRGLKKSIVSFIASQDFNIVGFEPEQFGAALPKNLAGWTVERADHLIRQCDGAVVLALARNLVRVVDLGNRKRGHRSALALPSSYNHLEGALALAQQLPVFILFEEGMDRTGIFNCGIRLADIPAGASGSWTRSRLFKTHFESWAEDVRGRKDVFLGYCSKANNVANEIRDYLESKSFSVLDWARDFKPAGPTILEEIERASKRCRCAIFLFTKDDELEKNAKAKASFEAVPRDNVLLEAGYFTQARGKERVAIVREKGTRMPADLGGIIYLSLEERAQLLMVKKKLVTFLNQSV